MPKKTTGLGKGSTSKKQAIERMLLLLPTIETACERGEAMVNICPPLGIHENTVKAWVRQGYAGVERIAEAQARYLASVPDQNRADADAILALMRNGLSAREACVLLGMSPWKAHNLACSKLSPAVADYMRKEMKKLREANAAPSRPGRPAGGSVYFIQGAGGGCIKIGFTGGHPELRRRDLQTGSPIELKIIHHVKASRNDEAWAHHYFRNSHSHGEWFWPSRDLMEFIASGVTISALRHGQPEQKAMTA
jgi:hypothetical protein